MDKPVIDIIAGARPNFVKIAPIIWAFQRYNSNKVNLNIRLVHTGQHYDYEMSEVFFEELQIPQPDIFLNCGSVSNNDVSAKILMSYAKLLTEHKPSLTMVVGDVDSTMACAIAAKKKGVDVAHVEAGIRSWDWSMPEEINRVITDSISDIFFTTSEGAGENLIRNGVSKKESFWSGIL